MEDQKNQKDPKVDQALQAQRDAVKSLIAKAGLPEEDFLVTTGKHPAKVVEVDDTVIVEQSENGSRFTKVMRKLLGKKKLNGA